MQIKVIYEGHDEFTDNLIRFAMIDIGFNSDGTGYDIPKNQRELFFTDGIDPLED